MSKTTDTPQSLPTKPNNLKRLQFALMKLVLRTVGRASDGIRIAFEHGFTSGVMLEYVYRNKPSGRWVFGPWIDRVYLNHVGWRVIRTRKEHLKQLLAQAVAEVRETGAAPCVLDVAAGPGLYLLETINQLDMADVTVIARDLDEQALQTGRDNARKLNLQQIRYERGDALDADSLASVTPAPNIIVASGFYDWIVDDELIRKSMKLIADRLPADGRFVMTSQTGHVDLAMAEALFVDFNKQPLRMKVRPIETMHQWAGDAGLEAVQTLTDDHGHYAVSLLRPAAP